MKLSVCIRWAVLALALPCSGLAASIELIAPDQTCHLDISAAHPVGMFSIVAVGGAEATCCAGFTGAEFRVEGLPGDWQAITLANPSAAVVLGHPFGDGVNIAFATASMEPSVVLLSGSLIYLGVGEPPPTVLRVLAKNPPSSPEFPCPAVTGGDCLCDYAIACVTGGLLYINGAGNCLVGVEPSTWSGVKQLYQ
jgi:hypothetical protein